MRALQMSTGGNSLQGSAGEPESSTWHCAGHAVESVLLLVTGLTSINMNAVFSLNRAKRNQFIFLAAAVFLAF